jgi:hypothetical protein
VGQRAGRVKQYQDRNDRGESFGEEEQGALHSGILAGREIIAPVLSVQRLADWAAPDISRQDSSLRIKMEPMRTSSSPTAYGDTSSKT